MLVLSRKRDEEIQIGNDIVIRVIEIRGDKVRIGIDAPDTVPVHRSEVYQAILRHHGSVSVGKTQPSKDAPNAQP